MIPGHRAVIIGMLLCVALDCAAIGAALRAGWSPRSQTSSATSGPVRASSPVGVRWSTSGPDTIVHAILVAPALPRLLYAATGGGFMRSDDGGGHWTIRTTGLAASDPQIWSLALLDHGTRLAAAGDDPHVYLSDDHGDHWRRSASTLGEGPLYAVAATPSLPGVLLAGGNGGIWRTDDGGMRWRQVYHGGNTNVAVFAWSDRHPAELYAGLVSGPGQILGSSDAGRTWRMLSAGLDGPEGIMALLAPSGATPALAGTMAHGIWRLAPGQPRWRPSSAGLPGGSHGAALARSPSTAGRIWAGTMGSGVFASDDAGRTWVRPVPPLPGNAGIVLALADTGGHLVAGTAVGIYRLPLAP